MIRDDCAEWFLQHGWYALKEVYTAALDAAALGTKPNPPFCQPGTHVASRILIIAPATLCL
jgi:hypothetical protein